MIKSHFALNVFGTVLNFNSSQSNNLFRMCDIELTSVNE